MNIPEKLKLLAVEGPVHSNQRNADFYFAYAETASDIGSNPFSTVRWTCIRTDQPFPPSWKVGAEVPIVFRNLDGRKGQGVFDVA